MSSKAKPELTTRRGWQTVPPDEAVKRFYRDVNGYLWCITPNEYGFSMKVVDRDE